MIIKTFDKLPLEAKNIRETVFIKEQGFQSEYDDKDEISTHFVMYDSDNTPVATCRLFESDEKNLYILGRLAVLKEHRGNNLGRKMVEEAEKYVLSRSGRGIILHAQCRAEDFYKKIGFSQFGEIGYEEGCPHIWMKKFYQIEKEV